MHDAETLSLVTAAIRIFLLMILPPLLTALVLGLIVGILQATMQIHDQTLPQTVKLLVVLGVYVVLAGALIQPLLSFAESAFSAIPIAGRPQ